ncbi:hypothetical protein HUN08_01840 [Gordonia sp. X0973]|uniref:hypothetical protein n=1 Tax=Gordonia sp. X0973 TaxID=2742602 RepID=UPI000F535940|nr:hypothetical protein [Gordonia sp. X0973]QKT06071.1 hypothetical protein HUN08_01840 [Gordonia sp. X0973]
MGAEGKGATFTIAVNVVGGMETSRSTIADKSIIAPHARAHYARARVDKIGDAADAKNEPHHRVRTCASVRVRDH